ncbi:uncharacterized protein LOC111071956 [Drosophila obscura]|uniref:uncharacterized protein LOC111071956 n=1 Tax=Drosophila obscura TaxID=7282 RepID=UPI001BB26113|nr:uncharacterized protein LOC111071956 [Drosophila obscura]
MSALSCLILALFGCLPLLQGQHQQQQQHAAYPAWLYAVPWRPLVPPTTPRQLPLSQLSPGYTGPQTFPFVQRQRERQKQREPEPQDLFRPQTQLLEHTGPPVQGMFALPFRPSPFAGYTDEYDEYQAGGGSLEGPARETERAGAYVYLSPGRVYSLFRS